MVEIVPYRAEHFESVKIRDLTPKMAEIVQSPAYLEMLEKAGHGYTLRVLGETVGAIVFAKLSWPGVVEVVSLLSETAEKHHRIIHRVCRTTVETVQQANEWHRMQIHVRVSSLRDFRWALSLGFSPEGVSRALGPGEEDFIVMARVRRRKERTCNF